MRQQPRRLVALLAALLALAVTVPAAATGTAPDSALPAVRDAVRQLPSLPAGGGQVAPQGEGITPPAPPCLPDFCVAAPEPPVTGAPIPGNMAYWGGRVQVQPKVYLVFVGWGRKGAFDGGCAPSRIGHGSKTAILKCDPDGAGALMADFVSQLGGTDWAGIRSQYYQVVGGVKSHIKNDRNQLAGIWVDDTGPHAGELLTADEMAQQAFLAAQHFKVPRSEWINSSFVIAQPENFSDPRAPGAYCAFHSITSNGIPYVNMPYVPARGAECGSDLVHEGARGALDGVSIVLGHELAEVVTNPDLFGYRNGKTTGGWYDVASRTEIGDKCAYVGAGIKGFPGGLGAMRGNRGGSFAVQSLWSNNDAGGAGYCAGAGNDLP